jgi:hypothetical protein
MFRIAISHVSPQLNGERRQKKVCPESEQTLNKHEDIKRESINLV